MNYCDMCDQVTNHPLADCPGLPQPPQPGVIYAGKYKLCNYRQSKVGELAKYWLENSEGEGMEVGEDKVEAMLAAFFKSEF